MVVQKPATLEEMRKIRGIGATRIKQYGEVFVEALQENI